MTRIARWPPNRIARRTPPVRGHALSVTALESRDVPSVVVYEHTGVWNGTTYTPEAHDVTATVASRVTEGDDGTYHWHYTLTNNDFVLPWSDGSGIWGLGVFVLAAPNAAAVSNIGSGGGGWAGTQNVAGAFGFGPSVSGYTLRWPNACGRKR